MMMKCDVPLPSTPDALDVYLNNIMTTDYPTEQPTTTSSTTMTSTTTSTTTQPGGYCQFYTAGNITIFDTGSPYLNDMRNGYKK